MSSNPAPETSSKATPASVAWSRVAGSLDRLFDCLEALDEAGGVLAAAEQAGWTPKAHRKADESIAVVLEALDRQLIELRRGRAVSESKKRPR
jgi:hypothetical protein